MRHLMNSRCGVLEQVLTAESNMDAHRVYRQRMTEDDDGNPCKEWLACRISMLGSSDLVLHSMRGSEITHRVYFVDEPRLSAENRLLINGVQYALMGIPQDPSQLGRLWHLDVKAITHQNELVKVLE